MSTIVKWLNVVFLIVCVPLIGTSQKWFPLYKDKVPNVINDSLASVPGDNSNPLGSRSCPYIQVFEPEKGKANGTGLLIFPGGGYGGLSWQGEGFNIAKAFNERGVTSFVVKYRLPDDKLYTQTDKVPIMDAVQAMRWVKQNRELFALDTAKIGCIGFSAGGHLAATFGNLAPDDARPKFMILVYPVVSMQKELTHQGSRTNLLGENPSQDLVDHYSNELQVTDKTPPAYITHAGDDGLVPVQNSIKLYEALQRHHINSEMRIYPKGDHGFIFGIPMPSWRDPMIDWLQRSGFYTPDIDGTGKTVILTFDDASQSHFSNVPDMLKPYGFGATFYVCEFPPDFADSSKNMNWRQIKALSQMGYEIGNHTWHHPGVVGLSKAVLESEIDYIDNKCRSMGIPEPISFCYPGYGVDSAATVVLRDRGFQTARTGGDRPWEPGKDRPLEVPAYTISGNNPAYFFNALQQATKDNAIVFCVHGVPDNAHPWVDTPREVFAAYLKYLYDHHFTVLSMSGYLQKHKNEIKK